MVNIPWVMNALGVVGSMLVELIIDVAKVMASDAFELADSVEIVVEMSPEEAVVITMNELSILVDCAIDGRLVLVSDDKDEK